MNLPYLGYNTVLQTLEIRHYGPVCDVLETGLYLAVSFKKFNAFYTGRNFTPDHKSFIQVTLVLANLLNFRNVLYYLLTNWLAYLYGRIQSPRPNVMPDRREGITRAAGFVFACVDRKTS